MEIAKKVVIITGGLGGIAIATVKLLLQENVKYVALFDIHESEGSIIDDLKTEYGKERVGFYTCDVTKREKFEEKYDEVAVTQGSVDVLINTAGIFDENEPELQIDVNFKGTVLCTLVAVDRMKKQENEELGGTIVNISSAVGLGYYGCFPVYAATKHAVIGFTGSLKTYYKKHNIRAMVICPGLTDTLMSKRVLEFTGGLKLDKYVLQSPENVGSAITTMLKKGKAGAVWVVQENQPPYALKDIEQYEQRRQEIS